MKNIKNRFLLVNSLGEVVEIDEKSDLVGVSDQFKHFVQLESGLNLGVKQQVEGNSGEPSYIKIANKLGFSWEKASAIGFVNYSHKAGLIMRIVEEYSRNLIHSIGFPIYEMKGSNAFDMSYPVVGAYAQLYGDRLLKIDRKDSPLVMSYDCSYPQFNLAAELRLQEKHLPFAHYSVSDCYRNEQRGECMLLYRHRRFFMPDLHPYFKDVKHAFEWYGAIEDKIVAGAKECGIEYFVSVEVASNEMWEEYKEEIIKIASNCDRHMLVQIMQDDKPRYWVINADYKIIDRLGQSREIGCIQIDIGNAERLGIKYLDLKGERWPSVIVHSAVPGGIERFVYMAVDNFPDSFPLWLHPIQARLIPVSEKYNQFASELAEKYSKSIRIDIDDRDEGVSKKVKRAREELIPNVIVVGEEELSGGGNISKIEDIDEQLMKLSKDVPFIQFRWPRLLSKRV